MEINSGPGGRRGGAKGRNAARNRKARRARRALRALMAQRSALSKTLTASPAPLLNIDRNFMVFWSPRSACSTVYYWFAHASGFADELEQYGRRIHRHRRDFYKSDLYQRSAEAGPDSMRMLKIFRDPYSRSISIYRHAITTAVHDNVTQQVMGEHFTAQDGFSFQEFLDFVGRIDLTKSDVHLRPQFHPFEHERKPDHYINIAKTDLFEGINAFERTCGLEPTDFPNLSGLHDREKKRKAEPWDDQDKPMDHVRLQRSNIRKLGRFPSSSQLLTPEAKEKIETIYKVDFDAYRDFL